MTWQHSAAAGTTARGRALQQVRGAGDAWSAARLAHLQLRRHQHGACVQRDGGMDCPHAALSVMAACRPPGTSSRPFFGRHCISPHRIPARAPLVCCRRCPPPAACRACRSGPWWARRRAWRLPRRLPPPPSSTSPSTVSAPAAGLGLSSKRGYLITPDAPVCAPNLDEAKLRRTRWRAARACKARASVPQACEP